MRPRLLRSSSFGFPSSFWFRHSNYSRLFAACSPWRVIRGQPSVLTKDFVDSLKHVPFSIRIYLMKNPYTSFTTIILFALGSVALSLPKAFGVVPAPDGGYPGFNTAEGQKALFSLTTGVGNKA